MLEFSKKVLLNVSFDKYLFQKELYKALKWIKNSNELASFRDWCYLEFGHIYPTIINKAFKKKLKEA